MSNYHAPSSLTHDWFQFVCDNKMAVTLSSLAACASIYLYQKWTHVPGRSRNGADSSAANSRYGSKRVAAQPTVLELTDRSGPTAQSVAWADALLERDEDGDLAHEFLGPFTFDGAPQPETKRKVIPGTAPEHPSGSTKKKASSPSSAASSPTGPTRRSTRLQKKKKGKKK